jgi:sugar lactone lactonase YvrE
VVIGVHSAKFTNEGQGENLRRIILRYGLDHPVLNDSRFQVWNQWGARAWPTLVLIDPAGQVVGGRRGEGFYPVFKPVIQRLIRQFEGRIDRRPLGLKLEREGLPETLLSFPGKVLAAEDRLFIADTKHNRILVTDPDGWVTQVIGAGREGFRDGPPAEALLGHPQGLALSEDRRILYVADTENYAIRAVDLNTGQISTLAGTGRQAQEYPPRAGTAPRVALSSPWDLVRVDDRLYIAMAGSHQIWVMDLRTGRVSAHAGSGREGTVDGSLAESELAQPSGLTYDGKGRLYFADSEGSSIRWANIDPAGRVGTLAGGGRSLFDFGDRDGTGVEARLQHPLGVDYYQGRLLVADTYNSKLKEAIPETGEVHTLLGDGQGFREGSSPRFFEPGGLSASAGRLYVADTNNHSIRVVDLATLETSTLVVKGLDRLVPAADYGGLTVRLDPVRLAPGQGRVTLQIALPPGYKVNDEAPSSVQWQVEGGAVSLAAGADRYEAGLPLPLEVGGVFREGSALVRADVSLVYCEAEKPKVCLVERVRLEAPVEVDQELPQGSRQLLLNHEVRLDTSRSLLLP